MNILSTLSAALLAVETTDPETTGFFQKLWNTLVIWFIDERGWIKIIMAVAVIVIGLLILKIAMAVFRKIINRRSCW